MTVPDTTPAGIAALLDGVTAGNWGASCGHLVRVTTTKGPRPFVIAGVHRLGSKGGKATDGNPEANARFIAAARTLVPALAAELARARELIALMEADDVRTEAEHDRLTEAFTAMRAERDAALAEVARMKARLQDLTLPNSQARINAALAPAPGDAK